MSNIFSKEFDIDKAAAELDRKRLVESTSIEKPAIDYVDALNSLTKAEDALKKALSERDMMVAAYNEQIRLLRLRASDARRVAEGLKVRRPRGRPPIVKR